MAVISTETRKRRGTLVRMILFAAATVGLIALIAGTIMQVRVAPTYRLVATFDNVNGLAKGDAVKVAGAPVGKVDDIEVVDGKAQVTLSVENAVKVPADTEAAVRWRNAIGQRVVYLNPGTSTKKLADGARVTKTRSVVDIGDLLTDLERLAGQREPGWANQLLQAFTKSLEGNEGNADELMANVELVTKSVAKRKATINQMIQDYKDVSAIIARRDKQIATMLDNLVALTGAFARNRELVDNALVELSGMISVSDKVLGQNAEALGRLVGQATVFTGGVRRNITTLEKTLVELGPLLNRTYGPLNIGAYAKGNVACTNLGPGPSCPLPMELPGTSPGAGKVDDEQALRKALLGDK